MIRRITAISLALAFAPFAGALADDVGGSEVIVIEEETAVAVMEEPVSAPPPPFVELQSTAIAAGIGARFGDGTLLVGGQEHPFKVTGVSLGDVGFSRIKASGDVAEPRRHLRLRGPLRGRRGRGRRGRGRFGAASMRNEKGVVITLESTMKGVQLTLGAQGLDVELQ